MSNYGHCCTVDCLCTIDCAQDAGVIRKLSERLPDIGRKMEYLLNTGAASTAALSIACAVVSPLRRCMCF